MMDDFTAITSNGKRMGNRMTERMISRFFNPRDIVEKRTPSEQYPSAVMIMTSRSQIVLIPKRKLNRK
jgi:hypothetical protein